MRTQNEWLCDTPQNPGCETLAFNARLCSVEGSEVALCRPCDARWKEQVRSDRRLQNHCPRCAPRYLASLESLASGSGEVRADSEGVPSGPVYDQVEQAMFAEGVLIDVRRRVLRRLSEMLVMEHV